MLVLLARKSDPRFGPSAKNGSRIPIWAFLSCDRSGFAQNRDRSWIQRRKMIENGYLDVFFLWIRTSKMVSARENSRNRLFGLIGLKMAAGRSMALGACTRRSGRRWRPRGMRRLGGGLYGRRDGRRRLGWLQLAWQLGAGDALGTRATWCLVVSGRQPPAHAGQATWRGPVARGPAVALGGTHGAPGLILALLSFPLFGIQFFRAPESVPQSRKVDFLGFCL